jgi:hypothetical protein
VLGQGPGTRLLKYMVLQVLGWFRSQLVAASTRVKAELSKPANMRDFASILVTVSLVVCSDQPALNQFPGGAARCVVRISMRHISHCCCSLWTAALSCGHLGEAKGNVSCGQMNAPHIIGFWLAG